MQKFFRGQRVKIVDKMPLHMHHFPSGVEAIVEYSYSDVYGKEGRKEREDVYSLFLLGDYMSSVAWYNEYQLTLINSDRDKDEQILQEFKEG